jgi:Flp pilus assembly protein TadG
MNAQSLHSRRQSSAGLALVEFVLLAPVLLLLLLMVAELGRALYQYNILSQAVRDGARYYSAQILAVDPNNANATSALITATQNLIIQETQLLPDMTADQISILWSGGNNVPGLVSVSASYDFQMLPGNPLNGILVLLGNGTWTSLTLNASVTMRAI